MTEPFDNEDDAVELLGQSKYDGLLDKTETAAQTCAERRDMGLPDEAIRIIQQRLVDMVVRVGKSDGEASVDGLLDEMANPEGRKAQSNIAFLLGTASTEHMAIRELGSEIMRENYEKAHDD